MVIFCPKCGTGNEERAKFCIGCGIKIEKTPPPLPTIIKQEIKREFPFQPKPLFILIGIILISSLYLLPIHTLNYVYYGGKTAMVTSATLVSECSQVGWDCPPYIGISFYILWIIGVGLIVFGFFQKKSASV
jgi:hypothetical protein